jgi:hypothetical protein
VCSSAFHTITIMLSTQIISCISHFNLFFFQSYAPELYLLEVENRDDENETTASTRPTTRSPQFTESKTEVIFSV